MKACGIIAEYNPFHEGHMHHIDETRRNTGADCIIAVMSGNFVQRGEPAAMDKWTRAETAVRNGVDLVIELPYLYATQSASQFARGGVRLLALAGCDAMSFGSECGNLENLQEIADTPVNPDHIRTMMKTGTGYPKAYSLLTASMMPNDILAVCYLRELKNTQIRPVLVERQGNYLDPEIGEWASGLALRRAWAEGKPLPAATPMRDVMTAGKPVTMERYYTYVRTLLLTMKRERIADCFLISEGLEKHLKETAEKNYTYEGFLRDAVTSRYTAGRIRRSLLQIMNQVTGEEARSLGEPDTLRVLAFNETGQQYLHQLRNRDVRIASRFADVPLPWRQLEYRTTLVYTSVLAPAEAERIRRSEIGGAHIIRKTGR
ncbi:MAG: nucleotidyltransferase family protein [Solobacterium sp.]|nr:nucleotidyltransferase family protein [Solobacterium sp.]